MSVDPSSSRGLRPALFSLFAFFLVSSGCVEREPGHNEDWSVSIPGAILLDDAFPDLVVEITYAGERRPSAVALAALEETLRTHTAKGSITILSPRGIDSFPADVRSHDDAIRIHDEVRMLGRGTWPWNGSTFYMHILYLNGQLEEPGAGFYHGNGRITVMGDAIYTQIGPVLVADGPDTVLNERVERRILVHEVGHAFGLVNCGIPMVRPHEAGDSECHSDQTRSVLHETGWTPPDDSPSRSLADTLEVNWRLDAYDVEDLTAFKKTGRTFNGTAPN